MNSTHKVEVFRVNDLSSHPNADQLDVVRFFNYVCVVRKGDFQPGQLAAYIPPDSLVPVASPGFAFLERDAYSGSHRYAGLARVRAKKLRGVQSQGLVIPAPPSSQLGDDVAEMLGIQHYESAPDLGGGRIASGPAVEGPIVPVYDLESWYRYGHLFAQGMPVVVTEKIHGTNCRVVFDGEKLHVGSRRQWKAEPEDGRRCVYREALARDPMILDIVKANPGLVFYGEVFGDVQDLKYGHGKGVVSIVFFDVFSAGKFLGWKEREELFQELPQPPRLWFGAYDEAEIRALIPGKTQAGGDHVSEGIVIEPEFNVWTLEVGRLKLKAVNPEYLERAK